MRSLFSITDLSVEEIQGLIDTANQIIADPDRFAHVCDRKKLATLFFEPSIIPPLPSWCYRHLHLRRC